MSLAAADRRLAERLAPGSAAIGAEFVYGVTREMAVTLGDLLVRRTHLAFETRDQAMSIAPGVARLVATALSWDADRVAAELRDYEREVTEIFG